MKIIVKSDQDANIRILLPTGLILNRFTAMFLAGYFNRNGIKITRTQVIACMEALKDYRYHHKNWKLVEVHSSDGDCVEIKI